MKFSANPRTLGKVCYCISGKPPKNRLIQPQIYLSATDSPRNNLISSVLFVANAGKYWLILLRKKFTNLATNSSVIASQPLTQITQ